MSSNILVTGGAGYIGSHACKALAQAGFRPIVLDDLVYGHRDFVRWGPLVQGDIRDQTLVADLIKTHNIEAVIHFAALAYVGESVSQPAKYYDNNVIGTLRLLQAMEMAGCHRIVFSSTCAVYGEADGVPISETTIPKPVNPYGRSKLVCEHMLEDIAVATDLDFTTLRYFNAAGSDPETELGEDRVVETHIIPRAMMALRGHVDDFQVFGADFPTPDGTAIRDYIHVSDLATAHVQALKRMLGGGTGGLRLNLGTGSGYSVRQVLAAIETVSGRKLPAVSGPRRPGDPAILVADPGLAKREIGFEPRLSDLDSIITTAWRWHTKAHPDRAIS